MGKPSFLSPLVRVAIILLFLHGNTCNAQLDQLFQVLNSTLGIERPTVMSCDEITLKAVKLSVILPVNISHAVAAYDNLASIFILGGLVNGGPESGGTPVNTIYEFNVIQKSVTQLAATLPTPSYSGLILADGKLDLTPTLLRNFIYLGVDEDGSETDTAYNFDTVAKTVLPLANVSKITENLAACEGKDHQGYIFGGPDYPWANITQIDLRQGNMTDKGQLLVGLANKGAAAYNIITEKIVIMGGGKFDTQVMTRLFSYNQTTGVSRQEGAISDLPEHDHPSSAYAPKENKFWLVGGIQGVDDFVVDGFYEINTNTTEIFFRKVLGFPVKDDLWISATAAVYVPSLWKMYLFGGWIRNSTDPLWDGYQTNEIYEIDLGPLMCCGSNGDRLANPDDCTKFLSCAAGGSGLSLLQCPNDLGVQLLGTLCMEVNTLTCDLARQLRETGLI